MWSTSTRLSCAGSTGQPGRQLAPSSAGVTGTTVAAVAYVAPGADGGAVGGGVFATAHDVGSYAQALLHRLADRPSKFPLQPATLELMTTPQQPGHTAHQLEAANEAARATHYPAIAGQNLFGFGWDIDTGYSRPRGTVFPVGSFGNTGFTGTTLWMDPGSDTYVVLLSNSIHLRGSPPISDLRGEVATAAAQALRLYGSAPRPAHVGQPGR